MILHTQIDPEEQSVQAHRHFFKNEKKFTVQDAIASTASKERHDVEMSSLPKFHIRQTGVTPSIAAELVRSHLTLDGNPALNLASFVHTGIDPYGLELCKDNITKNLADSDEYPALIELQQRCVSILSNLWNIPESERGVGTSTTGSSEAIMLGGLAMKRKWECRQREKGLSTDKPNIIMGANAQVALEKFARYFDVEMRLLNIRAADHFSFSIEDLKKNVDENTIGVFCIMGSTLTGHYQDAEAVSRVLDEYEAESGNFVPIHVDGASGAFVAPFVTPELKWDFRLPRVCSINTSGHKFGLTPVGCGWIIWRDQNYLPSELLFTLSYLGGSETTYTLNFSRPGHPIIYQYYSLVKQGFEGYQAINSVSLANSRVLSVFLEESKYFDVLSDIHRPKGHFYKKSGELAYEGGANLGGKPESFYNEGLPVVSFKLTDQFKKDHPFIPQEAISHMLRDKGYIIPNYPLPPAEEKYECLRIVINDNVSIDLLDQLMEDILRVTNRLISIGEHVKTTDAEAVLEMIKIIAAADHNEEEHEEKWNGKMKSKPHHNQSRC